MTLPANEPTDQTLVSELPAYIRENRAAINNMEGLENTVGYSDVNVQPGTTILTVGTELGDYGYESITMTGLGVSELEAFADGSPGQVKVITFQDADVELVDSDSKINGTFYLDQVPSGQKFEPQVDDTIALMNVGGLPGVTHGYWKELYRTLSVK